MRRETLEALNRAGREGRAAVRAVDLAGGEERLIDPSTDGSALGIAAAQAARADQSAPVEIEGRSWFLSVHNPPLDLAIVGAAHIAQLLSRMAALAGYRVRVIDPRTAFATPERFPGVALSHDCPTRRWPSSRSAAAAPWSRSPTIPRSTTRRWPRRCARAASISARSARRRTMPDGWRA